MKSKKACEVLGAFSKPVYLHEYELVRNYHFGYRTSQTGTDKRKDLKFVK